jgi:uncharacterized protein YecT (DUF1311 family)
MRALIFSLIALAASATSAKEDSLTRCLRNSGGAPDRPPCYEQEAQRRRTEQRALLAKLEGELRACEISWVGYHTSDALADLQKAQRLWRQFVQHECAYAHHTFGQGTDAGFISIQCEIEHHAQRNMVLRRKLKEAGEVKEMLRKELPAALNCAR